MDKDVPAPDDSRERLNRLKRELQRVCKLVSQAEELCDDLACLADELGDDVRPGPAPVQARSHLKPHASRPARRKPATPPPAIEKVILASQPAGGYLLVIDGKPGLRLSHRLGMLVEALSFDNGQSSDHLIGWKSTDTLARHLSGKTGHSYDRHGIHQLVYRLRRALQTGGMNPHWVMGDGKRGYRLARRRASGSVIPGGPGGVESTTYGEDRV
jgi:hypothetical protein